MKSEIYLHGTVQNSYSKWDEDIDFGKLTSTGKVISILEVCGKIKLAALSFHYDYLAIICGQQEENGGNEILYIISLKEKRIEALNSFANAATLLYFIPDDETTLILGSRCGSLFCFNVDNRNVKALEGHNSFPFGVSRRPKSDLLLTWSSSELLLWSWPSCNVTKRLKLDPNFTMVQGGHIWEKSYVVAAFDSGVVFVWDQMRNMKEHHIETPEGIAIKFKTFSISLDGEWIIGSGSQALIVIYSLINLKVAQVVHLSHTDSLLGVNQLQFLPYTHPSIPKSYIVRTSNNILVVDFTNSTVIKSLKSHNYLLKSFFVSGDGFLLGIVYSNDSVKLYTLLSFFPESTSTLRQPETFLDQVDFKVVNVENKKMKQRVESLLDATKWKVILEEFLEFPCSYRKHIWVSLMKLPKNFSVFNEVLLKSQRRPINVANMNYPDIPESVVTFLISTLQCLYFWAPFLVGVDFIPSFILPFVQFFDGNLLLSFETSVFVILNWCRFWFSSRPSVPEFYIKAIDDLIKKQDVDLHRHLNEISIPSITYCWLPLTSALSQVLTKEDWFVAWDHILSSPPSYILSFCAALTLSLRQTLLKCSDQQHAKDLFSQPTWIPIRSIIKKSKSIHANLELDENLRRKMDAKIHIPYGALPPFNIGPLSGSLMSVSKSRSVLAKENFLIPAYQTPEIVETVQSGIGIFRPKLKEDAATSHSAAVRMNSNSRVCDKSTHGLTEREQLNLLEKKCLENIKQTRQRLIGKTS